jgi:hypothetical protein
MKVFWLILCALTCATLAACNSSSSAGPDGGTCAIASSVLQANPACASCVEASCAGDVSTVESACSGDASCVCSCTEGFGCAQSC